MKDTGTDTGKETHDTSRMEIKQEFPPPSKKGKAAIRGETETKPASKEAAEIKNGEFDITDWSDYPDGPKPEGPFRLVEGQEYEEARAKANAANNDLHRNDPTLKGKQIHEVKPVKFGGSPTDLDNKIALSRLEHAKYTTWWNRKQQEIEGK